MKFIKAVPYDYHLDAESLGFIDRLLIKPRCERSSFYRDMFDEDFSRIFKILSSQNCVLFSIVSNDDELTQKLLRNVKSRATSHRLDETVRALVEEIARTLILFGTSYYFFHDHPENEELYFASFSESGIFRFLTAYIQLVPKRSENHWDSDGKERPRELRILDRNKLMRFNMPRSIKRMLSKQNRTLAVLDKHQNNITGFVPQATHENPSPTNSFDFNYWSNTKDNGFYRATQETGWNGRKLLDASKCSDFFDSHRLIRFRRNQLILRDHILFQLGNELTRIGRQYNARFHVVISSTDAMLKVAELDELEVRLSAEEASFTEVMNFCLER